jgi:hypothetical protein
LSISAKVIGDESVAKRTNKQQHNFKRNVSVSGSGYCVLRLITNEMVSNHPLINSRSNDAGYFCGHTKDDVDELDDAFP